jgi:hypothetical protein
MFKKNVENLKTHTLCSITFFFENRADYDKMWKNIVEPGRPQYGACALDAGYLRLQTRRECIIITAFPLQQWLHESA